MLNSDKIIGLYISHQFYLLWTIYKGRERGFNC